MPRKRVKSTAPTIDDGNPCYCPSIPPSVYLSNIREGRRTRSGKNYPNNDTNTQKPPSAFAQILRQVLNEDGTCRNSDDEMDKPKHPANTSDESTLSYPPWSEDSSTLPVSPSFSLSRSQVSGPLLKRKRSSSFSDLLGTPLFRKSFQSVHESSFEVSVKNEKLRYSIPRDKARKIAFKDDGLDNISNIAAQGLSARVRMLEDELFGPPVGTESPRGLHVLISRLDSMLPGMRLKDRLTALNPLTHQSIASYLGVNGHLNENVLSILRTSEITRLHLTPSLTDQAGLNIAGPEILTVFGKPNSFLFLSELNLAGTPLQDYCLRHIHHLPRLSNLILTSTGIGNEGFNCCLTPHYSRLNTSDSVFYLVSLKRSLMRLSLSKNPLVDNDAVPALVLLGRLSFLSINVTAIDISGLRLLCRSILTNSRALTVLLPQACERYILGIGTGYLLHPAPPLITSPDLCALLSMASLERNLAAHAAVNPLIITTGSRLEMIERLYRILKTRQEDLIVQSVIRGIQNE